MGSVGRWRAREKRRLYCRFTSACQFQSVEAVGNGQYFVFCSYPKICIKQSATKVRFALQAKPKVETTENVYFGRVK